jgi:hypothetical protein
MHVSLSAQDLKLSVTYSHNEIRSLTVKFNKMISMEFRAHPKVLVCYLQVTFYLQLHFWWACLLVHSERPATDFLAKLGAFFS